MVDGEGQTLGVTVGFLYPVRIRGRTANEFNYATSMMISFETSTQL